MSIFEKMFGGPKDVSLEMEEKKPGTIELVEEENKNKTLEDVRQAKEDLGALQNKRQELLNKHRDTAEDFADLGVREIPSGGVARSETYNEVLNPIEEELVEISNEINEKRSEFNLEPKRTEILANRMKRLEELRSREEAEFAKTEIGQKIGELKNKIKEIDAAHATTQYSTESTNLAYVERSNIISQIQRMFSEDKIAHAHEQQINKMNILIDETDIDINDAENQSYDENGQLRVK